MVALSELMSEGVGFSADGVFTKHILRELTLPKGSADKPGRTAAHTAAVSPNSKETKMRSTNPWRSQAGTNDGYSAVDDFQELFESEMRDLYRLAFLMIADGRKAEECLIAALDDCISGTSVPKKWVGSWARRVVIRNAIRIAAEPEEGTSIVTSDSGTISIDGESQEIPADAFAEFAPVLSLKAFERVVFVLCILERYRILDCALLLGRSQQDVLEAQSQAVEQVAACKPYAPRNTIVHKTSARLCFGENEERGEPDDSCVTLLN